MFEREITNKVHNGVNLQKFGINDYRLARKT